MVAGSPQCGLRCGDPDRLGREPAGAWPRTGWGFFYICEATRRRHAAGRTLNVDIPPSHRSGGAPPGTLLSGAHPNPDNRTYADIRRSGRRRTLAAFTAASRTDNPCLRRFHGCFTQPRAQLTVIRHSTPARHQRSSRPDTSLGTTGARAHAIAPQHDIRGARNRGAIRRASSPVPRVMHAHPSHKRARARPTSRARALPTNRHEGGSLT